MPRSTLLLKAVAAAVKHDPTIIQLVLNLTKVARVFRKGLLERGSSALRVHQGSVKLIALSL